MHKNLKVLMIVVVTVLVMFPFVRRGAVLYQYNQAIDRISISEVNISDLPDGVYQGSYDAILVTAEVKVTVKDGRITHIEYDHTHERGYRGEAVVPRVVDEQSLQVDTVSGATDSGKVLLKAIEKALTGQ